MEREFAELVRRVDRADWRLDNIDLWVGATEKRMATMEAEVVTEKSARELRDALSRQGQLRLTKWQQLAGVLVGLVAMSDLVAGFFR